MDYSQATSEQKVELIRSFTTQEEFTFVEAWIRYQPHRAELRNALLERVASLVAAADACTPTTTDHIQQDGILYELGQWQTLSEYAQHYGLRSTNIINNWISRGIVPPDCVIEIRQLNGIRLIRNQPYRSG